MTGPLHYDLLNNLDGPEYAFALGPLSLYIRREDLSWKVAVKRDPSQVDRWSREERLPPEAEDPALKWVRFSARDKEERLSLQPTFPPLPVVIRPYAPYVLRPSDKVPFYMSIPLSIRICSARDEKQIILEEPTVVMSKTWFGDSESGHLCQASRTLAVRELSNIDQLKHRIICPVRMRNLSDEVLPFDRFCLRTEFLDLYCGRTRFWSNEVGISYKGMNETSRMAPSPSAPSYEPGMKKIQTAAESGGDLFHIKSFFSGVVGI